MTVWGQGFQVLHITFPNPRQRHCDVYRCTSKDMAMIELFVRKRSCAQLTSARGSRVLADTDAEFDRAVTEKSSCMACSARSPCSTPNCVALIGAIELESQCSWPVSLGTQGFNVFAGVSFHRQSAAAVS